MPILVWLPTRTVPLPSWVPPSGYSPSGALCSGVGPPWRNLFCQQTCSVWRREPTTISLQECTRHAHCQIQRVQAQDRVPLCMALVKQPFYLLNMIFLGSCPPRTWMPSFWREPTQITQQCGSSLSHQWPRLWLWLGSETKDTGNEAALFARTLQKKCLSWLCYWGTCSLPQIRQYSLVCIFAEKVVWQALSHWTFSVRLVTLSPVTMTETLHMVHNFCLWVCNTNIGPIILRCHCCRYN